MKFFSGKVAMDNEFLDKVRLPLSRTQVAIKYLFDNDYIYQTGERLSLIDPLIELFLVERL